MSVFSVTQQSLPKKYLSTKFLAQNGFIYLSGTVGALTVEYLDCVTKWGFICCNKNCNARYCRPEYLSTQKGSLARAGWIATILLENMSDL